MNLNHSIRTLIIKARIRWRRTGAIVLRRFIRLAPDEQQRLLILTILIGVVCGVTAVAFHQAIRFAEHYLIENATSGKSSSWIFWTLLTPTLGGLLSGIVLQYVVPDARGSGVPQVKVAFAVKGGSLPFRQVIGKFLISTLQIGSGASLGREGPTVQICAGIASLFGRATALSRKNLRRLLPVGAAGGVAAAFNAPLAAVTFAIEEIVGDLDQAILSGIVVAAALAAVIERGLLGVHPVFDIRVEHGIEHASSLLLYAAMGVAAAIVSLGFTQSLLKLRKVFKNLNAIPRWIHPSIGGLVTGTLAVLALLWFKTGGVTGGGYDTLTHALEGKLAVKVLLVLCVMKLIATVFSYSSGGAGGIFAPSLFIGATLGGAFGYLDQFLFTSSGSDPGSFALVGMGAVFAGIIRAPITSVLIIIEMTSGYSLILPLMISNMTAYVLARRWQPTSIYDALLEQDGIYLPHRKSAVSHALEQIRVAEAMTKSLVTLPADIEVSAALESTSQYTYSSFPVLDNNRRFVGLISKAKLRRTLAEGVNSTQVGDLTDRRTALFPDQHLVSAVVLMNQMETRQLAVVGRDEQDTLIGLLSMSDIVKAQAHAVLDADDTELSISSTLRRIDNPVKDENLR